MTNTRYKPPSYEPRAPQPAAPTADTGALLARLNNVPVTPAHRKFLTVVALGLFFENYELFLTGALSSALERDFGVHVPAGIGLGGELPIVVSYLGGLLPAAPVSTSDRYPSKAPHTSGDLLRRPHVSPPAKVAGEREAWSSC